MILKGYINCGYTHLLIDRKCIKCFNRKKLEEYSDFVQTWSLISPRRSAGYAMRALSYQDQGMSYLDTAPVTW